MHQERRIPKVWRAQKGFQCWGKSENGRVQETGQDKQVDTHVTGDKQNHMGFEH